MSLSVPAPRLIALVGLTIVYALCFSLIKAGLAFAPPLLFGGLRAFIGGVALLGITLALRQPLLSRRTEWGGLFALALASTTLAYGAMFLSPRRTGAGIASVLGNMQPLMTAALAGPNAYGLSGAALALTASFGASAGNSSASASPCSSSASELTMGEMIGSGLIIAGIGAAAWNGGHKISRQLNLPHRLSADDGC
jgi:drug/metabolite transporter (DMT)-like permease